MADHHQRHHSISDILGRLFIHGMLAGCIGCVGVPDADERLSAIEPPPAMPESGGIQMKPPRKAASESDDAKSAADQKRVVVTPVGPAQLRRDDKQATVRLASNLSQEAIISPSDRMDVVAPAATGRRPVQASLEGDPLPLNLPTALSLVGGRHPVVGVARWRVREAYAQLDQARVLWLPTLQTGYSFHRHDGNYQASSGEIVDVNRNSFQYGLGAGATGAGTTPQPGLIAQFHFAEAIFQPRVARTTAWARGHAAAGVLNRQLRDAALAYLNLLDAHQQTRILESTRDRTSELAQLTLDYAEAGEGLRSDADRLRTELMLAESRMLAGRERQAVASAQLATTLSIDAAQSIVPLDPTVVPLEFAPADTDTSDLIATALAVRPELKESQALVAAACAAYRQQKLSPFVPSVLLGFSTGGFGGGLGGEIDNVDSRYDFDAVMLWRVRNFGWGEHAARRETAAQVQQAKYEKLRVLDQVAGEVAEAHSQLKFREGQIEITRDAIASAEASFERNLNRIRDRQGLPIEALQSITALNQARLAYADAVIDYNRAQVQLQYALGWPLDQ